MSSSAQMRLIKTALLLALAGACMGAASQVLDKIRRAGTVTLGYHPKQFPFSYEAADGKAVGFSVDLCVRIVALMQSEVGPVKVNFVPMIIGNRVALVANGTVDMLCGLTSENAVRDSQVAFLDPIFFDNTKIVVRQGSRIGSVNDMAGKRLVAVSGTSNMQIAMALNKDRRMQMAVVPVKDAAEGFRMVAAGDADGYLSSDTLLYSGLARSAEPKVFAILAEPVDQLRTRSIMIARDEDFKKSANTALRKMVRSGEFESLYHRWFEMPVEPDNVNLKLPMSVALRSRVAATKASK